MNYRRVVAVGAHADDIELGCGGVVARLVDSGAEVTMVVMTTTPSVDHLGRVFRPEGPADAKKAAGVLGVSDLVLGPFVDNEIPYSKESIQYLNAILDERQPELVITHWLFDNHQDHQHTARATLTAARHYPNLIMYEPPPSRPGMGRDFRADLFADVSEFLNVKIKALETHVSEYERLGGDDLFDQWALRSRVRGASIGVEAAEAFEVVKLTM